MSFALDVEAFARKTGTRLDQAARAIKVDLFNGVIRDTRVDTGRLRGNWQTTTGAPATGTVERLDSQPQGADGGAAQMEVMATVKPDTIDFLTNNLPYARRWELADGMIEKNIVRIDRIVREAVR